MAENLVEVSTIRAQMDELKVKYEERINADMEALDKTQTEIMATGGLQSEGTDAAIADIKAKMRQMVNAFSEEVEIIKGRIETSAEDLATAQSAAETSLHDSNV